MSVIIARHHGDFMVKSTETGQLALITAEEWAGLVRRIKSGHLDYTVPAGKPRAPRLDLSDVLAERIRSDETVGRPEDIGRMCREGTCGHPQHVSGADRDGETPPGGPVPAGVQGLTHERGTARWTS